MRLQHCDKQQVNQRYVYSVPSPRSPVPPCVACGRLVSTAPDPGRAPHFLNPFRIKDRDAVYVFFFCVCVC